jgi:NADPH2 dehydrogenase
MQQLTDKVTIKNILFKNRIVMPPMVCFGWADNDGNIMSNHLEHYKKRAMNQTGTIIVEAACINKNAKLRDFQIGIWSDRHISGLTNLANAIKQYGAVALVQIHHAGFKNLSESDLSKSELNKIRKDFLNATLRAMKAGFDGVELHGAHGYFISQMLSPVRNTRQDEYGGSLEKRFLLVKEIVRDIQDQIHDSFLLDYRMGGNEPCVENGIEIAKLLRDEDVNLLHVSAGIGDSNHPLPVPEEFEFSGTMWLASKIKEHVRDIPIIGVGGIQTPKQAANVLASGYVDFVAVGKALLADPTWTRGIYDTEYPIKNCENCKPCKWFNQADQCPYDSPLKTMNAL